jgi:hypothetical protein
MYSYDFYVNASYTFKEDDYYLNFPIFITLLLTIYLIILFLFGFKILKHRAKFIYTILIILLLIITWIPFYQYLLADSTLDINFK